MEINLPELKSYLRVVNAEDEGDVLLVVNAAVSHCESKLNRPILEEHMNDTNRWVVPDDVKLAIYLLSSHWYENRVPIGQVTEEMALSVNSLLRPHKFYNV